TPLQPSCQQRIVKLKDDGKRAIYEVTLWEKPWENFEQFNVKKVRTLAAGEQAKSTFFADVWSLTRL
ncbi:hypothetical protein OSTOST_11795, partial [Ostertagia ostertagi]